VRLVRSVRDMQEAMLALKRHPGVRIGLAPTMGCLHEGHYSLIRELLRRECLPVVSLFVNPAQFGPGEDYSRYPRTFDADCAGCEREGAAFVFAPEAEAMYPPGHSVFVEETTLSRGLCGASRPGHFRGVATVVTKLFQIVRPEVAAFGRKDAQQARIIAHVTAGLNMPVEIAVCPIVREPDGLALSSRNRYLGPAARAQAVCLSEALREAAGMYLNGERNAAALTAAMEARIRARPLAVPEYLAVVEDATLQPVAEAGPFTFIALAVRVDGTRLIDNLWINAAGAPIL